MSAAGPVANFVLCALSWVILKLMLIGHVVRVALLPGRSSSRLVEAIRRS